MKNKFPLITVPFDKVRECFSYDEDSGRLIKRAMVSPHDKTKLGELKPGGDGRVRMGTVAFSITEEEFNIRREKGSIPRNATFAKNGNHYVTKVNPKIQMTTMIYYIQTGKVISANRIIFKNGNRTDFSWYNLALKEVDDSGKAVPPPLPKIPPRYMSLN